MSTTAEPVAASARAQSAEREVVLEVRDLRTRFRTFEGMVRAVDGLTYSVHRGEALGIVGESGCGKSVAALSVMRLVEEPPGEVRAERMHLGQTDLLALGEPEMRRIRGNEISMIFQEPMTSLNPVLTIGRQIAEAVRLHQGLGDREALDKAEEMLRLVHIPEPRRRLKEYPFQLSGGMRQRVMIAMALSCNPKVLIADEATTALDVTIQAQILELINEMRERLGTAVVLITHDLGVVAETTERVVVMYAGKKVEEADVGPLFARPLHPYTRGLLASIPDLGGAVAGIAERKRLAEIPGIVPALTNLPPGCTFADRCPHATERCRASYPPLEEVEPRHWVACFEARRLAEDLDG
ncbi:MAG: ABC transporter ATP-binding protein [Ectothiorhodospiraceae bacterium]|nr:ABC transporter ATP-binding protein [Chromatiales bacterium]MCP5155408.1 ABC transporter ATP-binding protein [Ectothiorhodospiraceae bacterium]